MLQNRLADLIWTNWCFFPATISSSGGYSLTKYYVCCLRWWYFETAICPYASTIAQSYRWFKRKLNTNSSSKHSSIAPTKCRYGWRLIKGHLLWYIFRAISASLPAYAHPSTHTFLWSRFLTSPWVWVYCGYLPSRWWVRRPHCGGSWRVSMGKCIFNNVSLEPSLRSSGRSVYKASVADSFILGE